MDNESTQFIKKEKDRRNSSIYKITLKVMDKGGEHRKDDEKRKKVCPIYE